MHVDAHDHVLEVGDRIDVARLASRDERMERREVIAGLDVTDEEEVLAAERDHAQRRFARVVVDGDVHIVEEAQESIPLIEGIAERDAERSLRQMLRLLLDEPLHGKRYVLEFAPGGPRATGVAVADEERRAVESDYSMLGAKDAVFSMLPRPLAVGESLVSLGDLVRALLFKHASGPGGYSPSFELVIGARLEKHVALLGGDGGAFAVRVEPPPDPALLEHLWLDGELVLDAHGWPLSFHIEGRFDRRVFPRSGEVATEGRLRLTVAWT